MPPAKFRGLELRRQVAYGRIPPENLSRARRHEPTNERKIRNGFPNEKMATAEKTVKGAGTFIKGAGTHFKGCRHPF